MSTASIPVACSDGQFRGRYPLGTCATPVATPPAGSFGSPQNVVLSCATLGATIYYTTDGTAPIVGSSPTYNGPIAVSSNQLTINAIAIAQDQQTSAKMSAAYVIVTVQITTTSPLPAGTFGVTYAPVQLTATGGVPPYSWIVSLGTLPPGLSLSSSGIVAGIPSAVINESMSITATDSNNTVSQAVNFTLNVAANPAATPTFSPLPGTYPASGPLPISLACTTVGASIYYTLDGTMPVIGQAGTTLYTGSFNDAGVGTLVVNAIAVAPGYTQSAVGSATYVTVPVTATPNFPRLNGNLQGESGAAGYSTRAAKIALMNNVVTQSWPGWRDPVSGQDLAAIFALWKSLNPNIECFQYVMYEAYFTYNNFAPDYISDPPAGVWYEMCRQIQLGKWFAYPNGATKASNPAWSNFGTGSNYPEFNWTLFGLTYLGKTFTQWASDFYKRVFKDGGNALGGPSSTLTQSANPNIAGFMTDNQFVQYRIGSADYNCDGVVDSPATNPTYQTQCRAGNQANIAYLRSIWPGIKIIANCDVQTWIGQGNTSMVGTAYDQLFDGSLFESAFGQPYSYETFGSYKNFMQTYQATINMLIGEKIAIVMSDFLLSHGYALQRYAFTSALMNDGYFFSNDPSLGGYSSTGLVILDEYGFNLGQSVDPPQTAGRFSFNTSTWEGIWVREFANGYAICGARRSSGGTDAYTLTGDQTSAYPTFTLPKNCQRLTGMQDPVTNNGALIPAGTPITMTPRNGLILKKV